MYNFNNKVELRGRLTADPVRFENSDGSRKFVFTVAVKDNYKSKDGKKGSQFIPVEAFVSKDKNDDGVYSLIHSGDEVSILASLRSRSYDDKNGEKVFKTVVFVEQVQLDESKAVTSARLAKREGNAETAEEEMLEEDAFVAE